MKFAVTGGTGFVGRHLARELLRDGQEVVLVARGTRAPVPGARTVAADVADEDALAAAFAGCRAVAHCAGINRELGAQTFPRVHVAGTRAVVRAALRAGVAKVVLLSFLRARPGCGSPYHESKWKSEEIVRASGLDYTLLKAGVIYGPGDHMLDHLSHALHTFPVFGLVGFREKPVAPLAVEDAVRILKASLVDGRLTRKTVAVIGPERIPLSEAVRRVAAAVDRNPLYVRLPLAVHHVLGWIGELLMRVPLVSCAQIRILSEGVVDPVSPLDTLPADLAPRTPFSPEQIRKGLPAPGPFTVQDLRCAPCAAGGTG